MSLLWLIPIVTIMGVATVVICSLIRNSYDDKEDEE